MNLQIQRDAIFTSLSLVKRFKIPVFPTLPTQIDAGFLVGLTTATGVDLYYYDGDSWFQLVDSSVVGGGGLANVLAIGNTTGGINIIADRITSGTGADLSLNAGGVNTAVSGVLGSNLLFNAANNTTGDGGDITSTAGDSTTSAGGSHTLIAGSGAAAGGGGVILTAGNSTTGAGVGGPVTITSGDGDGAGLGGAITLNAGDSPSGDGGPIILNGGTGSVGGGGIVLSSGDAATASGGGGANITLNAGDGDGTGVGGGITLNSGDSPADMGGSLTLNSGDGLTSGGSLSLNAGTSSTGSGGPANLTAGDGFTIGATLDLSAGSASLGGGGSGGNVNLTAGNQDGIGTPGQLNFFLNGPLSNSMIRTAGGTTQLQMDSSALATPTYSLSTDADTGIHFPGGDSVELVTGGTTALSADAAQNVTLAAKLNVDATGGDAIAGTVALAAGVAAVFTSRVTASSLIFLSRNTLMGGPGVLSAPSASITAGVSFTVSSTSPTDMSTINWFILN